MLRLKILKPFTLILQMFSGGSYFGAISAKVVIIV